MTKLIYNIVFWRFIISGVLFIMWFFATCMFFVIEWGNHPIDMLMAIVVLVTSFWAIYLIAPKRVYRKFFLFLERKFPMQ